LTVAINQKIVSWSVVGNEKTPQPAPTPVLMERAPVLSGKTYKLKTPISEHSLYITINDCDGRPFEIFVNSKSLDSFQWTVALTRVMSAVFRHGGEVNFLIEELRSVFDPRGGFFDKGKYVPSLVAAIGDVLEQHLVSLGLYVKDDSLAVAAKAMVEAKQAKAEQEPEDHSGYPDSAILCLYCTTKAVVLLDGCATCLACGQSKCG
jgi:hypothetical protein